MIVFGEIGNLSSKDLPYFDACPKVGNTVDWSFMNSVSIYWYYEDDFLVVVVLQSQIIKSMLCVKSEDRPEASKVKTELEEYAHALSAQKNMHRDSKSVWLRRGNVQVKVGKKPFVPCVWMFLIWSWSDVTLLIMSMWCLMVKSTYTHLIYFKICEWNMKLSMYHYSLPRNNNVAGYYCVISYCNYLFCPGKGYMSLKWCHTLSCWLFQKEIAVKQTCVTKILYYHYESYCFQ